MECQVGRDVDSWSQVSFFMIEMCWNGDHAEHRCNDLSSKTSSSKSENGISRSQRRTSKLTDDVQHSRRLVDQNLLDAFNTFKTFLKFKSAAINSTKKTELVTAGNAKSEGIRLERLPLGRGKI